MEYEREEDVLSKTKHDEDGDGEHKRIFSEETRSVIIVHSETHSRSLSSSSSSSSSSASYLSPPKDLPEDGKEPEIASPPVQVMDRDDDNGNYDPNRIPSSVFERSKSNLAADWSCTSNESLFSIHLGRNSFTADMMKSGELYKSGELLAYSPALPMPPPPGSESKPVDEEESEVVDSRKEEEAVLIQDTHTSSSDEEEDKRESHEKEQHPAVSWKTPSTSYHSNQSSNSAHSFSFPILAGAASDSRKVVETEEQKKQTQAAEQSQEPEKPEDAANQKQPIRRWFSCFPPCPWCCSSCSCS